MKNHLKMRIIVAMVAPMIFALSSCSKEKEEKITYTGSFELKYKPLNDLLSVADIQVTYYDETGTLRTEPVTQAEWTKKITYKQLPVNTGFKIVCTAKNPLPQDKATFSLGYQYNSNVSLLRDNGEVVSFVQPYFEYSTETVSPENIAKKLLLFNVYRFYEITENGITEM